MTCNPYRQIATLIVAILSSSISAVGQAPAPADAPRHSIQNLMKLAEQGDLAYNNGDTAGAEQKYRHYWDAANNQDWLIDALQRLVKSLFAQQKYKEAKDLLDSLPSRLEKISVDVGAPEEKNWRNPEHSYIVQYWTARCLVHLGQHTQGLQLLDKVLLTCKDPLHRAEITLARAICYFTLKNWATAERIYLDFLAVAYEGPATHVNEAKRNLALAYIAQKKFAEAHTFLERELKTAEEPLQLELGMRLLALHMEMGQLQEAYAVYQEVFAPSTSTAYLSDTRNYPVLLQLAHELVRLGQFDNATLLFERLLPFAQGEERRKEVMLQLIEAYVDAKKLTTAIDRIALFIKRYPSDPQQLKMLMRMASLHQEVGLPDSTKKAMAIYDLIIKTQEAPAEYKYISYMHMAQFVETAENNLDKAIDYFHQAAALPVKEEDRAGALFYAGEKLRGQKKLEQAGVDYKTVADTYPTSIYAERARLAEADCFYERSLYLRAAEIYTAYVTQFPEGNGIDTAMWQLGMSHKRNTDYARTMEAFKQYAERFAADTTNSRVPSALIEAADAALKNDRPIDAKSFLATIVEKYPQSKDYPYALYRKIELELAYGQFANAQQHANSFLAHFSTSHPDLATNVYLWMGVYRMNRAKLTADKEAIIKEYQGAGSWFKQVIDGYPQSSDAPLALYESAKCSWYMKEYADVQNRLTRLAHEYPQAPQRIQAQADFLMGDVYAQQGQFEEAADRFRKCHAKVPKTRLGYAALGRLGDSLYAMTVDPVAGNKENWGKALACFEEIIEAAQTIKMPEIQRMARLRAARIHDLLDNPKAAISQLQDVFYDWKPADTADRYHYAKSGFMLANLFIREEKYFLAKRVYRVLADSKIEDTLREEARRRFEDLDKADHGQMP